MFEVVLPEEPLPRTRNLDSSSAYILNALVELLWDHIWKNLNNTFG